MAKKYIKVFFPNNKGNGYGGMPVDESFQNFLKKQKPKETNKGNYSFRGFFSQRGSQAKPQRGWIPK